MKKFSFYLLFIISLIGTSYIIFFNCLDSQSQFKTYVYLKQKNIKQAELLFNKLIQQNNEHALRFLLANAQTPKERTEILKKLVVNYNKGIDMAFLAREYEVQGQNIQALEWYDNAATQNNVISLLTLGRSYEYGNRFTEKNLEKAFNYYMQLSAIDYNFSFLLLPFYEQNLAEKQNLTKAYAIYYYRYIQEVLNLSKQQFGNTQAKLHRLENLISEESVAQAKTVAINQFKKTL